MREKRELPEGVVYFMVIDVRRGKGGGWHFSTVEDGELTREERREMLESFRETLSDEWLDFNEDWAYFDGDDEDQGDELDSGEASTAGSLPPEASPAEGPGGADSGSLPGPGRPASEGH